LPLGEEHAAFLLALRLLQVVDVTTGDQ
jgi:hypothetical protein